MCNKATKWTWPWGAPSHRSRSHFVSGYRAAQPWSLGRDGLVLAASPAGAAVPPVPAGPGCAGGQQLLGQGWDRALGQSLSRPHLQLAAGRSVQLAGLLHCCAGQGLGRRSVQ